MIPEQLKQHLKRALCSISMSRFSRVRLPELSCLMYHRVVPAGLKESGYSTFLDLGVCRDAFEEQMRFIARHYNCISLSEAILGLETGQIPTKSVVVTFDDGYRDNFTEALPILEKYSIPATIFVCTGLIDRSAALWWNEHDYLVQNTAKIDVALDDYQIYHQHDTTTQKMESYLKLNRVFKQLDLGGQGRLQLELRKLLNEQFSYEHLILDWHELKEFAKHPLITVGAHTMNHPVLKNESSEVVLSELKGSRERLELELGAPVEFCAFPFGEPAQASNREAQLAKEAGFRAAFSTVYGHLTGELDRWYLPRIHVAQQYTMADFMWKLRGTQNFAHSNQQSLPGL